MEHFKSNAFHSAQLTPSSLHSSYGHTPVKNLTNSSYTSTSSKELEGWRLNKTTPPTSLMVKSLRKTKDHLLTRFTGSWSTQIASLPVLLPPVCSPISPKHIHMTSTKTNIWKSTKSLVTLVLPLLGHPIFIASCPERCTHHGTVYDEFGQFVIRTTI